MYKNIIFKALIELKVEEDINILKVNFHSGLIGKALQLFYKLMSFCTFKLVSDFLVFGL
jgi:hypothetical protein